MQILQLEIRDAIKLLNELDVDGGKPERLVAERLKLALSSFPK
jgi:hypothetical protein